MIQTKTNARSALTTVVTMPTVLTPKVHLTVVANQGTWEMATTVRVGAAKSLIGKIEIRKRFFKS